MTKPLALVVDDEPDIRELLDITLSRMNIATRCAENLQQAHDLLKREKFQLCLTDMHLPDGSGISLVQHIQETHPSTPVAVITAYGSMDAAIAALKAGAFDFVSKPVELSRLRELVNTALKLSPLADAETTDPRMLGKAACIQELREKIAKLARSQAPVYIAGESGSGKELVARLIHDRGPRAEKPFVPVNCGAIPSELMESEFFGHRKGSFTGATEDKPGLFQSAHEGTLFLDEVADLPLPMQVKLLRAIQEKAVRPVGGAREIPVDVRIISATHKDLATEVAESRFRQDLFYRINVIPVRVPPLRERGEDILLLANHFLKRIAEEWGISVPSLSKEASRALQEYPFPGNVRELQNTLERAVTLCDNNTITAENLQLPATTSVTSRQVPAESLPAGAALEDYLEEIEKREILKALDETRWNRTAAAKKLGMTFRSLRYRLKKMGLDTDEEDGEAEEK